MAHLDLALRLHNLRQRECVVAVRLRAIFRSWSVCWLLGLTFQLLLAKQFTLGFQALFHFPYLAVVLLQHISRFQQLFKSLLVENWFVVLIGHDLYLPPMARPGGVERPESYPILVQLLRQKTLFMKWMRQDAPSAN